MTRLCVRHLLVRTIDLGNVGQQVEHAAGVAPLVVVPGDELDENLTNFLFREIPKAAPVEGVRSSTSSTDP